MTELIVIEAHAEHYAARIRRAFPALSVRTAATTDAALDQCAASEAVIALAHDVSEALVARMPKLRWVGALTTGTDHLDTLTNLPPEIMITSGRGIHGPQMAELAFYYMIGLFRDVRRMMVNQAGHRWERWPQRLVLGKTVVIVGVGAISEELAVRCQAFGMTTIGVSAARTQARGFDRVVPRDALLDMAALADVLVALVPYGAETHHLFGDAVFAAMKPTALFINIARGKVVDEPALVRHLQAGGIGGAGLDVFDVEPPVPDNPLWDMPNVILTPRIGGMSDTYAEQALPLLIDNIGAFLQGREMRNMVTRRATA